MDSPIGSDDGFVLGDELLSETEMESVPQVEEKAEKKIEKKIEKMKANRKFNPV